MVTDSPDSDSTPSQNERMIDASASLGDVSVVSDDLLVEALERLAETEHDIEPSRLPEFVPEVDKRSRHFILVELIKMSMAMASEAGTPRWLDDYFAAMPNLISAPTSPLDLVMEEIQLRREAGETPDPQIYLKRFPQFANVLDPLLGGSEATSSTKKIRKPDEVPSGTLIDDFEIIQTLGKGAFAHVYLARQLSMSRLVALKVSLGTGDEPQALAQFDHRNIVRVFDQREMDDPEVHLLYMQFHPGGTLADVIKELRASNPPGINGQLLLRAIDQNLLSLAQVVPDRSSVRGWIAEASWPRLVAWIGIQLSRALQEAHDRGVMHRDVKPANVLLTAEGIPQLADFNVSMAGAAGRAGAASSFGGSVGYMSPEHLRAISPSLMASADDVRESADLYSLAVLLWELWQGHRPFACPASPGSWTTLVADQLESRSEQLLEPIRVGTASERVLESVLRSALSSDPADRPGNGTEMAGRLRLALHPDAAKLFDPEPNSIASRIMRWSPWWIAAISILLPHIAAGWFNYEYNIREIMTSETRAAQLHRISIWVNSIAFPLAVVLMVWFTRASVKALKRAGEGLAFTAEDLKSTLDLGHRAAIVGGACWMIAGVVYPVLLQASVEDFGTTDASHIFVSLLMSGGVAMIYPMFSLALVTSYVYYPKMVRPTMQDPEFDANYGKIVSRSESYFLIAAIIPLLGATLMISGESESRDFMKIAIAAGMVGLVGSFFAYRAIVRTWSQLGEVLSTRNTAVPE